MVKNKQEENKIENTYDLKEALNSLDTPFEHLKEGFEYYINHNAITIKDNATLQKEFKKFKEGV